MRRCHDKGEHRRANVARGAKTTVFEPPAEALAVAERACEVLGLDFAGVDLLFGKDGEPILCEVNSNAHFEGISAATGVDSADRITEHVINCMSR